MMKELLAKASFADEEERKVLLSRLVEDPAQYLKPLADILTRPEKHLWSLALQVIQKIGYPQNASLLPEVVEHLCDGNWPGWMDAVNVLKEVPPAIVVPLFVEILLDAGEKRSFWDGDVEGLCVALSLLGSVYCIPCLPSITYILIKCEEVDEPDTDFLLRPFTQVEPIHYTFALPALLKTAKTTRFEETRTFVTSLIKACPAKDLAFYLST